jgi:hypothetical protein
LPAIYVLQSLEDALATVVAACVEHHPLHHQPLAGGPPPRSGKVFESSSS